MGRNVRATSPPGMVLAGVLGGSAGECGHEEPGARYRVVRDGTPEPDHQPGNRVLPALLIGIGQTFRDGLDFASEDVDAGSRDGKHVPATPAPSVDGFLRVYVSAVQDASGVVSIHLSPGLSAIQPAARTASEPIDDVLVRVVDGHSAAVGHGFVVPRAARAAAVGTHFDGVVARARNLAPKVNLQASINTREYPHWGRRIGGVAALVRTIGRASLSSTSPKVEGTSLPNRGQYGQC